MQRQSSFSPSAQPAGDNSRQKDEMETMNDVIVHVGPYTIKAERGGPVSFLGIPDEVQTYDLYDFAQQYRSGMQYIAQALGLIFQEIRTGVQERGEFGHGKEALSLVSEDGTLIFEMRHVNHCKGPGHRCSYSHGPWFKVGGRQQPAGG